MSEIRQFELFCHFLVGSSSLTLIPYLNNTGIRCEQNHHGTAVVYTWYTHSSASIPSDLLAVSSTLLFHQHYCYVSSEHLCYDYGGKGDEWKGTYCVLRSLRSLSFVLSIKRESLETILSSLLGF